jgi:hypothetical protein
MFTCASLRPKLIKKIEILPKMFWLWTCLTEYDHVATTKEVDIPCLTHAPDEIVSEDEFEDVDKEMLADRFRVSKAWHAWKRDRAACIITKYMKRYVIRKLLIRIRRYGLSTG